MPDEVDEYWDYWPCIFDALEKGELSKLHSYVFRSIPLARMIDPNICARAKTHEDMKILREYQSSRYSDMRIAKH